MFILSLDGGGIRGVLTARLIKRLETAHSFLHRVDMIAGTSTGGILALGLAKGLTPQEIINLYVEHGDEIFACRDIYDRAAGPADEYFRADYDNRKFAEILGNVLGPVTLADLKKKVLIVTFDLDNEEKTGRNWKPKFLHNFSRPGNDGHVSAIDAALRTSAAPTYFPSYHGFVDGGVVCNNPATCAVANAIKGGTRLEDISLLSVGTGFNPHVVRGDRHDWGNSQWIRHIMQLVMDGMPGVADYQCRELLSDCYARLDAELEQVIELDDVARVNTLLAIADRVPIDQAVAWLRRWQDRPSHARNA